MNFKRGKNTRWSTEVGIILADEGPRGDDDLDIFVHEKIHHDKYLRFMYFTVCVIL